MDKLKQEALTKPCPFLNCKAKVGQECHTAVGLVGMHRERLIPAIFRLYIKEMQARHGKSWHIQ